VLFSGCATKKSQSLQVVTGDRSTLAFTGKGAAAGIMMDAFLGGAGVAIGIAIDEGIAKDIANNLSKPPTVFNMVALVEKKIFSAPQKNHRYTLFNHTNTDMSDVARIVIETYGFRTAPGDDQVTAWMRMRFVTDGKEIIINYPADFESPATADLNKIKNDSVIAAKMLGDATDLVISKWLSSTVR
jgi:hypothetical protein